MRKNEFKEGLGDLAHAAERDHEVQMARADLYKIAKYAIKLHDMLKGVSEAEGLQGWQQAKITTAAEDISSVYHNLDYEMKFGQQNQPDLPVTAESYKVSLTTKLANMKSKIAENDIATRMAQDVAATAGMKPQQFAPGEIKPSQIYGHPKWREIIAQMHKIHPKDKAMAAAVEEVKKLIAQGK